MSLGSDVIAQDAAARLGSAACKYDQDLWDRQERAHARARTPQTARAAAAPLLAKCVECPVTGQCRAWAEVDEYTGIAAGAAWVNGQRREAHWVLRHSPREAGPSDPQ